jgi:DNA-binding MarR family transcriptional regulator
MSKPVPELATHAATLEVRDHCLCLHAQRAARALARRFDLAFRPLGLTSGQFSLLNALNRPEPPGIGAVAAVLAMDRTTLTAALKPLERRGLVRVQAGEDRRSRRVALTDAGRALLGAALPVWRRVHAKVDAEVEAEAEAAGGLRGALVALSGQGTSR